MNVDQLDWELGTERTVLVRLDTDQHALLATNPARVLRGLAALIALLRVRGFVPTTLVISYEGAWVDSLPATVLDALDRVGYDPGGVGFQDSLAMAWIAAWNPDEK